MQKLDARALHRHRCAWFATLLLVIGMGSRSHTEAADDRRLRRVESGYVLFEDTYIPPPYLISTSPEGVQVNGCTWDATQLSKALSGRFGPPGFSRGPGRDFRSPRTKANSTNNPPPPSTAELVDRVEQWLTGGGMLVRFRDGTVAALRAERAAQVVDVLLLNTPIDHRRQLIEHVVGPNGAHDQWKTLLVSFRPTDDLRHRYSPADNSADEVTPVLGSRPRVYLVTVVGMMLATISFGNVMRYRPEFQEKWQSLNASPDGAQHVLRCAALIVVLSVFDLGCTLWTNEIGSLWEVNPLGSRLLASPLMLTLSKLGLTGLSVGILIPLRKYHGTQVASWWLSLVLALVTARWITFHSMLMA